MIDPEHILEHWSDLTQPATLPVAGREAIHQRMLETMDRYETQPYAADAIELFDPRAREIDAEIDEIPLVFERPPERHPRSRWLAVAAACVIAVAFGAVLTSLREQDNPDIELISAVQPGAQVASGVHMVDDFRVPFTFLSTSEWNVLAEDPSRVLLADPSAYVVEPDAFDIIDNRTLSIRFFLLSSSEIGLSDVEALFRDPPSGVSVGALTRTTFSGRPALRTTLVVADDAPCEAGAVCQRFPANTFNDQPLNRGRTYEMIAVPHSDAVPNRGGVVLASVVLVDDRDPWNETGLATLESITFTDTDGS